MANDYVAKRKTVLLSDATSSGKEALLDMIDLPEFGVVWRSMTTTIYGAIIWR